MLDQFPATAADRIDRARGERYLSSAAFEPLGLTTVLSQIGQLVSDDDGSTRKDFRVGDAQPGLENRQIEERTLPEGTPVTIIGYWSEARQGFVPAGAAMIRLFPGDIDGVQRLTGGNAVKSFAMAVVFFTILHGMLVPMYFMSPRRGAAGGGAAAVADAASVLDERDCDRQKTLLAAGAD